MCSGELYAVMGVEVGGWIAIYSIKFLDFLRTASRSCGIDWLWMNLFLVDLFLSRRQRSAKWERVVELWKRESYLGLGYSSEPWFEVGTRVCDTEVIYSSGL